MTKQKQPKKRVTSYTLSEQHLQKIERLAKLTFGAGTGNNSKALAIMIEKYKL